MNVLVYGAGPLGSLFAARLQEGGHQVSLLARGQRLTDLREHGIVLVDYQTGEKSVTHVQLVERLDPEDAYDLVLVIMRKNKAVEILSVLAANRHTPNVLFLMNNAAGPGELVTSLGQERVMMGFPMAAGYRRGHEVHYLIGAKPGQSAMIPIGEVEGTITSRIHMVGQILGSMPGFAADIRTDIDAWLKTHVALLMPSLAPAMRAAGRDNVRMAHTRDLVVLAVRAMREGFWVLKALGYPITPDSVKKFEWIPEPILVWVLQRRLVDPRVRAAMLEHAEAAQDEIKHLADEFLVLARQTSVPTPAIDRLYAFFDPATPQMPEGSSEILLDWRGVWVGLTVMVGILGTGILLPKLLWRRRHTQV
jgi:2-dehydropantoate 2-reductase